MFITRQSLSPFIIGKGIEIGAYHNPWPVQPGVDVTYVDKHPYDKLIEMRNNDPWLGPNKPISRVDIVDDGEFLSSIPDASQDFVLSSHQLEHCFSPLTAIKNHLRVLKPGGKIFYVVPDKRFTFDKDRTITSITRLLEVHLLVTLNLEVEIKKIKLDLYSSYYKIVDKVPEELLKEKCESSYEQNVDIHFHCWDNVALLDIFNIFNGGSRNGDLGKTPFEMQLFSRAGHENFVVLTK
jgi:SAM-dependent methyltransferase